MSIKQSRVLHLNETEKYLIDNLNVMQGGYATDTGMWIIRINDKQVKKYYPDDDMRESNSIVRYEVFDIKDVDK